VPEEIAPRDVFGKTLVELGHENPDIVVLDADLAPSTMTHSRNAFLKSGSPRPT
jgi:transketolase C-terminal domain/subunit